MMEIIIGSEADGGWLESYVRLGYLMVSKDIGA